VAVLGPKRLIGLSAGDSEAWVVTATQVADLTRGQRTRQRLGSARVDPVVFEREALSGTLLVATDGLFKYAAMDVIAGMVRASEIRVAAERLVDLVRLRSGKLADDVALVLVSPTTSRPSIA
jgi:PPM family protein phosphatase